MPAMPGIFRRWAKKTALCKIPLHENLSVIFNILETATGIRRPPGVGNGYGWDFSGSGGSYVPVQEEATPKPFDIESIVDSVVTLKNVILMAGNLYVEQAGTVALSLTGTQCYVVAVFNTDLGTVGLSSTLPISTDEYTTNYLLPLYQFKRSDELSPWEASLDLRGIPHAQVYQ